MILMISIRKIKRIEKKGTEKSKESGIEQNVKMDHNRILYKRESSKTKKTNKPKYSRTLERNLEWNMD